MLITNNIAVNARLTNSQVQEKFLAWMMIRIQRSQDNQESAYFFYKLPRTRIILFVVESIVSGIYHCTIDSVKLKCQKYITISVN